VGIALLVKMRRPTDARKKFVQQI